MAKKKVAKRKKKKTSPSAIDTVPLPEKPLSRVRKKAAKKKTKKKKK